MTLTAEGLRVLSGQLPFQCPVGEGKAHRAEPGEETGWARYRPGPSCSLLVTPCSQAGGGTGRSACPLTPMMDGSYCPGVAQLPSPSSHASLALGLAPPVMPCVSPSSTRTTF